MSSWYELQTTLSKDGRLHAAIELWVEYGRIDPGRGPMFWGGGGRVAALAHITCEPGTVAALTRITL